MQAFQVKSTGAPKKILKSTTQQSNLTMSSCIMVRMIYAKYHQSLCTVTVHTKLNKLDQQILGFTNYFPIKSGL